MITIYCIFLNQIVGNFQQYKLGIDAGDCSIDFLIIVIVYGLFTATLYLYSMQCSHYNCSYLCLFYPSSSYHSMLVALTPPGAAVYFLGSGLTIVLSMYSNTVCGSWSAFTLAAAL